MKDEVQELLDCHAEGDYLDFKEDNYSKDNKDELVKDIIAFANSHSVRDKFIIIGAKEQNNLFDGFSDFDTSSIDESKIQQIITSNIKDDLDVKTKLLDFDGHPIFAIKIPVTNNANRPFMAKKQLNRIKENEMFIRRGSSTVNPSKRDLELMFKSTKYSKLVLKSFKEKVEDKIIAIPLNERIKDYKNKMYNFIVEQSKKVIQLKSNVYEFRDSDFLISKEVISIDKSSVEHIKLWFSHINLEYSDDIFEFNNIRWKTSFGNGGISGIGKVLCGDKNEMERYNILKKLNDLVLEYLVIDKYAEKLPLFYCTSLLISNEGTYLDEDIELKLIIRKNNYVDYSQLLLDEYDPNYLGNLYKNIKKEFECPITSLVEQYSSFSVQVPNISPVKYPYLFGDSYTPTYLEKIKDNMEDIKMELTDLYDFEKYEEGEFIILKFNFPKVMQNSSIFIKSKLLFNSDNITIDYEIKSKNNKDIIYGTISS
jgi:hypothetical protein